MDEKYNLIVDNPFKSETIEDDSNVYRQVHFSASIKEKGRRFPNEAHFKPDPDGLSVYWDKKITVEEVLFTIGLSYNFQGVYKKPSDFLVFKMRVGYLRGIDKIENVRHTPVYKGNPAPVGYPNIPSHSSVLYPDDEEIRVKLSDHCRNDNNTSCPFELKTISARLDELRARLNDTSYHKISDISGSISKVD